MVNVHVHVCGRLSGVQRVRWGQDVLLLLDHFFRSITVGVVRVWCSVITTVILNVRVVVIQIGFIVALYFSVLGKLCPAWVGAWVGYVVFPRGMLVAELGEDVFGDICYTITEQRTHGLAPFPIIHHFLDS